jgi:hypothetical protein
LKIVRYRVAIGVENFEADQAGLRCHPAQGPPGLKSPFNPRWQVTAGGLVLRDENLALVCGRGTGDDAGHVRTMPDKIGQSGRWVVGHRAISREQAGEVAVQVRYGRISYDAPGEVRMIFVDAGVNDRPDDALP